MILGEHQRYLYLQQMGIDVYYPRFSLPGAKPSAAYVTQLQAIPEPAVMQRTDNVRRALAESLGASVPVPLAAAAPAQPSAVLIEPAVAQEAPASKREESEALRFVFAYIPVSEDLAVINELPWASANNLTPVSRKMLAAMLRALSLPCEERDLNPMLFTWPLFNAPGFELGADSARHTLDGFLAKRLQLRPVRHLLVLAEQSTEYIFPTHFDWQAQKGLLFAHPRHDVQVLLTHSLSAMEAVPELKRSAWQDLQPLRAALSKPGDAAAEQEGR